jgi:predicted nucleotidyltransferase component of viral defense system
VIPTREVVTWAEQFGVASEQIRRDHFISHVINSLGSVVPDVRFFGGTALCRTLLEGSRLSEDIDLLDDDPRVTLDVLREHMVRALRREFPDATWDAPFADGDGQAAMLDPSGMDPIKIYVGRIGPDTRAWSFEVADVQLRYSDLPPTASVLCPTPSTFAAMKLAAWFDRHAPRDLFDLAGLARRGVLADPEVSAVFRAATGIPPLVSEFERAPRTTIAAWRTELEMQVRSLMEPQECLALVHDALQAAGASPR